MGHASEVGYESLLQTLLGREGTLPGTLRSEYQGSVSESGLDPHSHALVRIAALASTGATAAAYAWQAEMAEEYGVTPQEMLGVLVALKPTIGLARVTTAAAELSRALGLEETDATGQQAG